MPPAMVINDAKSAAVTGLFDAMALIDFAHAKATIKSIKKIKTAISEVCMLLLKYTRSNRRMLLLIA